MVRAEREHAAEWGVAPFYKLVADNPFYRVQYAHGVVHHAVGIYYGAEHLLLEPPADVVGEAGAHEEHSLHGLYLEVRLRDIYRSAELHNLNLEFRV